MRRRTGLFAVREHPLGRTPPDTADERELKWLRAKEREIDLPNRIADHVAYLLLPEIPKISNATKMSAYKSAIDQFSAEMPAGMVRMFVDAMIAKLQDDHRKMLAHRAKAEAERRARRRAA